MLIEKLEKLQKELEIYRQTGRTTKIFNDMLKTDRNVFFVFPTHAMARNMLINIEHYMYKNINLSYEINKTQMQLIILNNNKKIMFVPEEYLHRPTFYKGNYEIVYDHTCLEFGLSDLIKKYKTQNICKCCNQVIRNG